MGRNGETPPGSGSESNPDEDEVITKSMKATAIAAPYPQLIALLRSSEGSGVTPGIVDYTNSH